MMTTLTRCVSAVAFLRVEGSAERSTTDTDAILADVLGDGLLVHDCKVCLGHGQVDVGHVSGWYLVLGNVVFCNALLFTSENILSL